MQTCSTCQRPATDLIGGSEEYNICSECFSILHAQPHQPIGFMDDLVRRGIVGEFKGQLLTHDQVAAIVKTRLQNYKPSIRARLYAPCPLDELQLAKGRAEGSCYVAARLAMPLAASCKVSTRLSWWWYDQRYYYMYQWYRIKMILNIKR